MLKTAREVFILTDGGAEVKSYSSAGQAILLLVRWCRPTARSRRGVDRTRLVRNVTLFFASHVVLFALAVSGAGLHIGIVYFLWVGIFNLMVIAQFWALAADLYTPEQGKRLFPLIGVGSSLGALAGSLRAGRGQWAMGPMRLLITGGATLVVCARPRGPRQPPANRRSGPRKPAEDTPLGKEGGFTLIRQDRYLMLIAALTGPAERREHVRRVSVRTLRRRAGECDSTVSGRRRRRRAQNICRRHLQSAVQHRQLARPRAAAVRRVARVQVSGPRQVAVRASDCRGHGLRC